MKRIIYILSIVILLYSCDNTNQGSQWDYPAPKYNPEQLQQFIDTVAASYPAITQKEVIGITKDKRDIIALIISGDPGNTAENEPRIRLTGSIHGDEHVTTALLCELITYLTEGYSSSLQVQNLVDNRYIAIIPMLNPDGVASHSRYNGNGVDLNRNFNTSLPEIWTEGDRHGDHPFSENETLAIEKLSINRTKFHLSATYHSGAAIINLPFDYVSRDLDGIVPVEYPLVQYLAKEHYSRQGSFLDTPDLLNNLLTEEGTINGGDWYVVNGSLQDWSYLETGCIDLTIEVSDKKYGHSDAELEAIYGYNINSMLSYIEAAGFGVSGKITDAYGDPAAGAVVSIPGSDLLILADNNGYYHKILHGNTGDTCTIQVKAAGFKTVTKTVTLDAENIVTADENFTLVSE